eukprot:702969-Prymnesium_polylepis.1
MKPSTSNGKWPPSSAHGVGCRPRRAASHPAPRANSVARVAKARVRASSSAAVRATGRSSTPPATPGPSPGSPPPGGAPKSNCSGRRSHSRSIAAVASFAGREETTSPRPARFLTAFVSAWCSPGAWAPPLRASTFCSRQLAAGSAGASRR